MARATLLLAACAMLFGCSKRDNDDGAGMLTREQLLDPQSCAQCHPNHVREWSGSMHAYAAEDPLFRALNARGQRETNGELGDFCVNCHAPMAVREGLTTDGLNLDDVPRELRGVTCYFCHSVDAVEGDHNNPLRLADDLVMRGGYTDPAPSTAHRSAYSELHDRNQLQSSQLCGACHDVVTPLGAHIERTFKEWQDSLYSRPELGEPQSCSNCHMRGRDDFAAAVDGAPVRRVHDHAMPGVDLALTPWPERDAQREAVQRSLDTTVLTEMCVFPERGRIAVSLENISAGHAFPSGSVPDRRAWVEVIGYLGDDVVFASGALGPNDAVAEAAAADPTLWWFGDLLFDADGAPTHFFWDAASYQSNLLPAPAARSPLDPRWFDPHQLREYTDVPFVDRVTARVRLRAFALDIARDLVASGDLDPAMLDELPTFDLAASAVEWHASDGKDCVP